MEKKRVMIVEDDAVTALYLRSDLARMGYEVACIADTGEKAIDFAARTHLDLIIMDIRLKGDMDGISAAITINRGIPVIYHSAYIDDETKNRAAATRPVAYLEKPAPRYLLQDTLAQALS